MECLGPGVNTLTNGQSGPGPGDHLGKAIYLSLSPTLRVVRQKRTSKKSRWTAGHPERHLMSKVLKPGQDAPRSGQYEQIGPRGGRTGDERTVTRGEPMPPTPKPGMGYVLVDSTKH